MADPDKLEEPIPFPDGTDPVRWAASFTDSIDGLPAVLLVRGQVTAWFAGAIAAGRLSGRISEQKLCSERLRHANRAFILGAIACAAVVVAITVADLVLLAVHGLL